MRTGEPVVDVQARIARGELEPIGDQVLVSDMAGRPLDWLPLIELGDARTVPDRSGGGAEPVLDQVTTLRDGLSALFEANAAYGPVVDGHGSCVGLLSLEVISASFTRHAGAG